MFGSQKAMSVPPQPQPAQADVSTSQYGSVSREPHSRRISEAVEVLYSIIWPNAPFFEMQSNVTRTNWKCEDMSFFWILRGFRRALEIMNLSQTLDLFLKNESRMSKQQFVNVVSEWKVVCSIFFCTTCGDRKTNEANNGSTRPQSRSSVQIYVPTHFSAVSDF